MRVRREGRSHGGLQQDLQGILMRPATSMREEEEEEEEEEVRTSEQVLAN
jgi:hypothetical protein